MSFFSIILLVITMNLMACQKKMTSNETVSSEPVISEVDQLLSSLISDFKIKYSVDINYSVTLDSNVKTGQSLSNELVIGLCEIWASGNKFVYINNSWFSSKEITNQQRKILVFHELAHCSLNRDHDLRTYNDGMPYSMMYPIINQIVPFFSIYENYYLTELANNSIGGNDPFLYKINLPLKEDFLINEFKFLDSFTCK